MQIDHHLLLHLSHMRKYSSHYLKCPWWTDYQNRTQVDSNWPSDGSLAALLSCHAWLFTIFDHQVVLVEMEPNVFFINKFAFLQHVKQQIGTSFGLILSLLHHGSTLTKSGGVCRACSMWCANLSLFFCFFALVLYSFLKYSCKKLFECQLAQCQCCC